MFESMGMHRPTEMPLHKEKRVDVGFSRGAVNKAGNYPITVTFPRALLEDAGYKLGDRVDMLINEPERKILIPFSGEDISRGWTLSKAPDSPSAARIVYVEFPGCLVIDEKFRTATIRHRKIKITDAGILMDMPDSMKVKR